MIKVTLVKRLKYALFGHFTIDMECPHGKFITGTYQAGRSTNWGCDKCPMHMKLKWHLPGEGK